MLPEVILSVVMIGAFMGLVALYGGISRACLKKRVDRDADEAMDILDKAGVLKEEQ